MALEPAMLAFGRFENLITGRPLSAWLKDIDNSGGSFWRTKRCALYPLGRLSRQRHAFFRGSARERNLIFRLRTCSRFRARSLNNEGVWGHVQFFPEAAGQTRRWNAG
jgi:hypothetical protein